MGYFIVKWLRRRVSSGKYRVRVRNIRSIGYCEKEGEKCFKEEGVINFVKCS